MNHSEEIYNRNIKINKEKSDSLKSKNKYCKHYKIRYSNSLFIN